MSVQGERHHYHLTRDKRLKLEAMYRIKTPIKIIAKELKVHRSNIYRELKRGAYVRRTSEYEDVPCYSADLAQDKYEENLKAKGAELKIGNNIDLANRIEELIVEQKYSPDAALARIRAEGKIEVNICTGTLYNCIDKGIFYRLSNNCLPVKRVKKRNYKKIHIQKRATKGTSIEDRPKAIESREEFGHWEMDEVKGKKGKSRDNLLVLTERKTRQELIFKVRSTYTSSVVNVLNHLEKDCGKLFSEIFKTITVDNGSEFQDCDGMERTIFERKEESLKRTAVYYCHPFSSYERGSNEVGNKLIRRFIPKGSDIDPISQEEINVIQNWMNTYPRRLLGYRTSQSLYDEEIEAIKRRAG